MAPLKRVPELIPLSHDHRSLLFLAQNMKTDGPKFKGYPETPVSKTHFAISQYEELLQPHMELEEICFDKLGKALSEEKVELINLMKIEHGHLRDKFELLDLNNPDIILLNEIGHLLEAHIRFEERELFMRLQEELSGEQLKNMGAQIEELHKAYTSKE